jgi:HAD superfamily hydrolase (TIGR01509 family)
MPHLLQCGPEDGLWIPDARGVLRSFVCPAGACSFSRRGCRAPRGRHGGRRLGAVREGRRSLATAATRAPTTVWEIQTSRLRSVGTGKATSMTNPMRRPLKAVLFDLDGTLVDTTYLHTITWWQALHERGRVVPMARIHRAIGMGSDNLLRQVLGTDHDTRDDSEICAAHGRFFAQLHDWVSPTPGARELLQRCAQAGHTVVLASSATRRDLRALRDALDADEAIDVATSSEDADESKPSPDILSVALTKTGVTAGEVVFVGDAVWDVKAFSALRIPCVGLECGGTSAAELREAGAIETWRDPDHLLHGLERSILSSPAFPNFPGIPPSREGPQTF